MSNAQGAIAEPQGQEAEPKVSDEAAKNEPDVTVEETEANENASPDTEANEVQETPEQRLERLEKEVADKQKAIDRRTAALSTLQKKFEEERQQREQLMQRIEQAEPKKEPDIDDFDTHEEYVDAVANFRAEQKVAEQQKQMLKQQEEMQKAQIMQERQSVRAEQEAEYMKENPLYRASVSEVDSYLRMLEVRNDVQDAVIDQIYSGNVPAVIDYFGSNNGEHLDELGKISKMPAHKAAVEIYKIQQKLEAGLATSKTDPEKPDVKPVKVERGNTKSRKSLDKQSPKEILDWVKS